MPTYLALGAREMGIAPRNGLRAVILVQEDRRKDPLGAVPLPGLPAVVLGVVLYLGQGPQVEDVRDAQGVAQDGDAVVREQRGLAGAEEDTSADDLVRLCIAVLTAGVGDRIAAAVAEVGEAWHVHEGRRWQWRGGCCHFLACLTGWAGQGWAGLSCSVRIFSAYTGSVFG